MKKLIYVIVFLAAAFSSASVFAQSVISVRGVIRDSKGEPVIGAVVVQEGKASVGVVTDIDGKYSISVPDNSKLNVSCISYKSVSVDVSKRAVIDIVMEDDSEQLDEVVVVGYGSMRRSDLTGSVASIKIDEDDAGRSTSVDQLMQGKAAGVNIVNNSAAPDAGVTIRVRGINTFNGDSQPLFVVDGVIMNSATSTESTISKDGYQSDEETNGLLGINPQDIASMEILKDASATAIYGNLGANGVVLITTKQANRDKPVINASVGMDISSRYKKMPVMEFDEYCDYLEVAHPATLGSLFTDVANRSGLKVTPVNWQDYIMRTAVGKRFFVSISGRPSSFSYSFSFGYSDKEGIIKGTNVEQFTTRLNLTKTFSKKFQIGTKINAAYVVSNATQGATGSTVSSSTSMTRSLLSYHPYRYLLEGDDDDEDSETKGGPDKWLTDFRSNAVQYRINPSIFAEYKFSDWLTFKSTFGGDFRNQDKVKFKSSRLNGSGSGALGAVSNVLQYSWNWDNLFLVSKSFKNGHSLSGTVGMTMHEAGSSDQHVEAWNVLQWKLMEYALNSSDSSLRSYSESKSSTLSFLARAVYNYKDRYTLTATGRYDGTSKFQKGNRWAFFPSFAFAWRINQEPWFRVPVISTAKLRLGWGQVGNQGSPAYRTLSLYTASNAVTNYPVIGEAYKGLAMNYLPNPDLKWESTMQYNAGVDFGMWRGRLSFSVDAYYKVTDNLLQNKTITASSGFSTMWVNNGGISNRGIEFALDATPVKTRNFELGLTGNISFNRNKIESIGDDIGTQPLFMSRDAAQTQERFFPGDVVGSGSLARWETNIYVVGQPMGLFYGLATNGINQTGEESPGFAGSVQKEGSVKYLDLNGDGLIDNNDRTIIGDPNPDFTYGFGADLKWKNFTLAASFNGSFGNDIYNVGNMSEEILDKYNVNHNSAAFRNAWTPENASNKYPSYKGTNGNDRIYISDRFVEDASYLRLSSLSIAYRVPIDKKKSKVVKGISVSAAAGNLFVWTKYSGWDPEVNARGSDLKKMALDIAAYPSARNFSFDVKFTF